MAELLKIITEGESETVEFKTSFSKDVIETTVAFANTRGGTVLIGISDEREVVGVTCSRESLQIWANEIKQNSSPAVIPSIKAVSLNNKTVVRIQIDEFPVKPVAFKDRYYKRVANSNHRMTLTEITNVHLQSWQFSWDAYPDEVRHEYGVSLIVSKPKGDYDAVVLAVSHEEFKRMSEADLKEFCGNPHVIYDIKNVLPRDLVDARL